MKVFNTRSYVWLIYAILWGMVWGYPVLTTLVIAVRGGMTFSWNSVLHDWAGILPFFLLFLLHRLPVHFLFMRHRVRVYILSVVGGLCLFGFCRYYCVYRNLACYLVNNRLEENPFRAKTIWRTRSASRVEGRNSPVRDLPALSDTGRFPRDCPSPCCWIS